MKRTPASAEYDARETEFFLLRARALSNLLTFLPYYFAWKGKTRSLAE
jgi:hypothetical protein